MGNETAMLNLKEDLILTKSRTKDSFSEIENQEIKDACIKVVEMTLNSIITRIDTELLEMEKEQIIKSVDDAQRTNFYVKYYDAEQYYNETYQINKK